MLQQPINPVSKFSISFPSSLSYLCLSAMVLSPLAVAQDKLIPKSTEAIEGQGEAIAKSTGSNDEKRALIEKRIAELHAKQAEFLKKVADGDVQTFPNMRK